MRNKCLNLEAPDGRVDLLIIAGEASGDEHAASLVFKIKEKSPQMNVYALGGPKLNAAGAKMVFNLVDHAVVGVFEVLKKYGFFRELFNLTLEWIRKEKPKTILLVDYPGFNLRLASSMKNTGLSRKGGGNIKVLQYVSPQLWAWKPKRRFKMDRVLDALGVIFPFELDCYKDVNLPVSFVGHPLVEKKQTTSEIIYDPMGPILLLPGSRQQPVEYILPILLRSFEALLEDNPNLLAILPVPNLNLQSLVGRIISLYPHLIDRVSITSESEKVSSSLALMSSGTMSLRCALSGIPGVIVYRTHPITYILGKMLVKVPHLGMANLLLPSDPPYAEFIQGRAQPKLIFEAAKKLITNHSESRRRSQKISADLRQMLSVPQDLGVLEWLEEMGAWE